MEVALASGLVVEQDADRYRFPHDIVRRTLVAQLSAARRRALHHDLAGAIEALRADELDAQAPVLAHHAAAGAGPRGDARAVHWSRAASAQATARSAPAEAVRLCRQALVLVPAGDDALRAAVTAELGEALVAAGDAAGPSTLVEGADLAARAGQPDVLAAAAMALADAADDRPDLRPDALRLVRAASATPDEDPVRHARLLARAIRLGDEAVPAGDAVEALHAQVAAVAPGAVDARRRLAADLAVLAEASGEPRLRVLAAHDRAMAAATLGDEPAVEASLADLRRWAIGDDRFARAVLADRAAARTTATGPPAAAAALLAEVAAAHDALAPGTGDAAASRHRAVLAHLSPAVGATAPGGRRRGTARPGPGRPGGRGERGPGGRRPGPRRAGALRRPGVRGRVPDLRRRRRLPPGPPGRRGRRMGRGRAPPAHRPPAAHDLARPPVGGVDAGRPGRGPGGPGPPHRPRLDRGPAGRGRVRGHDPGPRPPDLT